MKEEEDKNLSIFDIIYENDPYPLIKKYIYQNPSKIFTELENDNFTSN